MERIKLEDFTRFHFISGLEFSGDGAHACFAVHKANLDQNDYDSNLWVLETESGRYFQLTALNKERAFTWLKDSEHIVFMGLRDPKDRERRESGDEFSVFYKISIHGGEAVKFFDVPFTVSLIEQIDSDNFLLLAAYNPARPSLAGLDEAERAKALKQRKEDRDYEVLETIPYWSNGRGFISGTRNRIYLYNAAENSWKPLTGEDLDVSSFALDPTGSQAVVIAAPYKGKRELENQLYLLDLKSGSLSLLASPEHFRYYFADFLNDKMVICAGSDGVPYGLNQNPLFYTVDLVSKEQSLITPGLDLSIGSSVGSDCRFGHSKALKVSGGCLYFTSTEGGHSYLNRLEPNGQITRLNSAPGSVDGFAVHDNKVLLVCLKPDRLQEVYRLEQDREAQITHFNDWFTAERSIVKPEPVSYTNPDGLAINGWVLKPVDWDPQRKYPAILNIHGGPKTVYGEVYFHEMQYWANQGYFVMFCNPRGSDGRGNDFADIRGKYGTIDYEDLMGFTDTVLAQYPSIDSERLGVAGGSYGGFMTNWIIGHTNRFKAAASQRSISNWVSMAYTTDIGYYFVPDQIGVTAWEDAAKLWDASPLKYADRVQTPTLFIHSEEDYRCWLVEGLQMFTALKYHGVETRLCMFRGENHELSRSGKPKHRIRRLKEISDWFARFLKGDEESEQS